VVKSTRWLAIAVFVMVFGLLVLWRGCRSDGPRPSGTSGKFDSGDITLTSPELDLELVSVGATARPGYSDWACLLRCAERGGCRADIRVRILYRVAGEQRTLHLSGRLDAERGETTRVGRVQRPVVEVERIDEVIVEVAAPFSPDEPRPTPMF
jgi:hypothetical protein